MNEMRKAYSKGSLFAMSRMQKHIVSYLQCKGSSCDEIPTNHLLIHRHLRIKEKKIKNSKYYLSQACCEWRTVYHFDVNRYPILYSYFSQYRIV